MSWACLLAFSFSLPPSSSQIPTKVHRRYLAYDWPTDAGNKPRKMRAKSRNGQFIKSDKLLLKPASMSEDLCLYFLPISARSKKPASPSDLAARKEKVVVEVKLQGGWTPKMVPRSIACVIGHRFLATHFSQRRDAHSYSHHQHMLPLGFQEIRRAMIGTDLRSVCEMDHSHSHMRKNGPSGRHFLEPLPKEIGMQPAQPGVLASQQSFSLGAVTCTVQYDPDP